MSSTLKKYLNVLQFIATIKNKKLRSGVLKEYAGFKDFYDALQEIAVNTVDKNVPLSRIQKRKLRPHKRFIMNLTKRNRSRASRKRNIVQSGGFLPYLIPIITSLLLR